jgi:hypothetical protein
VADKTTSTVISTRPLSALEMDNVLSAIGATLFARGYEPMLHSRNLLEYRRQIKRKKFALAIVRVADLPVEFTGEEGGPEEIVAGHAFGISSAPDVAEAISTQLQPYQETTENLISRSSALLVGKTFEKKVTDVACDHCGTEQVVTVPIKIDRIEGTRGYGPGGCVEVKCCNCHKTFDVTWTDATIEIRFT